MEPTNIVTEIISTILLKEIHYSWKTSFCKNDKVTNKLFVP